MSDQAEPETAPLPEPPAPKTTWELEDYLQAPPSREREPTLRHQPHVKPHFPDIVGYIYLSRYATAEHVFRRFPKVFTNYRTCNRHLQQLVHLKHLARVDVQSTSVRFPHVYICTQRGMTLTKRHFGWDIPPSREEAVMLPSIMHELYLTGFELEVWRAIQQRPDLSIKGLPERRYHLKTNQLVYADEGSRRVLTPDAGFILCQQRDEPVLLLHLVEMDNGTMAPGTILKKFHSYHDWWHDAGQKYLTELYRRHGRTNPKPHFRLLVLIRSSKGGQTHDRQRLIHLYRQTLQLPADTRSTIWFTTVAQIKSAAAYPVARPIWWPVRDATAWLDDFKIFTGTLKQGRGQKPQHHERQYVAEKLASMKHRCLLPQPHPAASP